MGRRDYIWFWTLFVHGGDLASDGSMENGGIDDA